MGVAVGDFNNDGFPDVLITCVGPEPAVPQYRQGHVRRRHAHQRPRRARRASAPRRSGSTTIATACSICSSATTSSGPPDHDVFCSLDGKQKSYCTPEAYRGDTCWLFHNRGNGTFEDVTATSGVFDSSSKSLGVALIDTIRTAGRTSSWPTTRSRTSCIATCGTASSGTSPSRPGWPSARKARRAPAWASTPPTSTTPARPAWSSPTSTTRWSACTGRPAAASTRTSRSRPASGRRRAARSASAAVRSTSISTAISISSSSTATSTRRCGISAATSGTRSRRTCS